MNSEQQRALLTIALYAAFADGHKAESERETIRQMAESLSDEQGGQALTSLYQDVLLRRVSVTGAVQLLHDPAHRQLAYEMAVCVCDADGNQSDVERAFLADLCSQLGLSGDTARGVQAQVDSVAAWGASVPAAAPVPAEAPLSGTGLFAQWGAPASAATASAAAPVMVAPANAIQPQEAELDKSILNYAVLNGALELLPQSWASMAIIPLQIKMVYAIGKAHGVALDTGHIKEFIAAAGVGLTSQYLEQFGRKLMGGLFGKVLGKTAGKLGSTATGMAFSFATTYALGQLAKRYYAGGRNMNTSVLRSSYQDLLAPAKQLQTQYLPQIQQKAATLDMAQIMALVKGNGLP